MDYIPIVDLSRLTQSQTPSGEDWKETAGNIFKALNGIGFVYLKNHGINPNTIRCAFEESQKFFKLPDPIKELSLKDITKSFNGYAKPGQESLMADAGYEIRESYDVCGSLRYFPDSAPKFGPAIQALESESKPLIKTLLRVLAISLELEEEDFFVKRTRELDDPNISSFSTLRSLYYPPTWENKNVRPGVVRCADHSDYGTLTLLFQDQIGGLEVKGVKGEWIPADPILETILVNTGDLLEFWSAGIFPATHHRVLVPEAELKQKTSRQSIVYFVHPDDDVIIRPIKTPRNADTFKEYPPVTAQEHAKSRLDKSYNY